MRSDINTDPIPERLVLFLLSLDVGSLRSKLSGKLHLNFLSKAVFHHIVMVFECLQLPSTHVELIDHLVTLAQHFGIGEGFDVLE